MMLPKCHCCRDYPGKRRRQNTRYHDDELNWVYLCDRCYEINEEEWAEQWREYWASVL